MRHRWNSGKRAVRLGTALLTGSLMIGGTTFAVVLGSSSAAEAASSCTFDGQASLLTGVTPGEVISIACTGLPPKTSVLTPEASALAGLVQSSNQEDEADVGDLGGGKSNSAGVLATTFTVPSPFTAVDPQAACPPTQAQVNAGQEFCTISVATITAGSYGTVNIVYAGQLTPQTPTVALSPTSAGIGQQVAISDGSEPDSWWGNSGTVTPISSADISIGGAQPASTSASISATTYNYNPASALTGGKLSGSFVVPCGVAAGTSNVTVTEANTTGLPGTVSATAPLTLSGSGLNPAITGVSPTQGSPTGDTTVTITGCNFTGVTSVMFGSTPAVSFTVNSDTQITAVAPAGTGQVNIVLNGPHGTSPVSIATQFSYGSQGYTLAGADGGVFTFGGAFHGSLPGSHITPAKPIVGVATNASGGGYWLAGADGGVFSFGDAGFHGSLGGQKLAKPIVGIASVPDGGGYWLVGADGGVFSFGDAGFHGSMAGKALAKPIVGIVASPDGGGYWLVAADGGVFGFGNAGFHGSMAGKTLAKPIVSIVSASSGGYDLIGADGGVDNFGSAAFSGSLGGKALSAPIVSGTAG